MNSVNPDIDREILGWLINWFASHTGLAEDELSDKIDVNFFELGWVDSFAFINLIAEIEETFSIEFAENDFENRDFSTLVGLSRIAGSRRT